MVTSALKPANFSRNKVNTPQNINLNYRNAPSKRSSFAHQLVSTNLEVRSLKNSLYKDAKNISRLTEQPQFHTSSTVIP